MRTVTPCSFLHSSRSHGCPPSSQPYRKEPASGTFPRGDPLYTSGEKASLNSRNAAAASPASRSASEAPIMVRSGDVAASRGSSSGLDARRGPAALLVFATLAPVTAVAQKTPQPVFTELFAYDPAAPSQLLGKWRISSQLDSKLQPLRVGGLEDPIGKTVGRVTVQEGDGLEGASDAMLQARRYVCDSKGSRAAVMEAEPGGVVPSERAEIQVRSDRVTGAGELVKFGQPVWYRFSFKIAGDWPQDVPAAGRTPCRTVLHQIKQDSFKGGNSCNASPFLKIEARPLGKDVRFFAQVAAGAPCAQPPMMMRAQICRRDLPRESWTTVQVRLNPAHDASGRVDIWLHGAFCGAYQGPLADRG